MPEFQLTTLDLIMVLLYVIFIVALGFYFAKRTKTPTTISLPAGRSRGG